MAKSSSRLSSVASGQNPAAQRVRMVLGSLVALNLIAAGFVLFTPGGSAESLERELGSLQTQVSQARARLEQTRKHTASVEKGRTQGDEFLGDYFVGRRSVFSELLAELNEAARASGLRDRGNTYTTELIEGSETLGSMVISANYEGTYTNLLNFVREIDHSPSLLIIESLSAAPQQGSNMLTLTVKLNAFWREDGSVPLVAAAAEGAQSQEGAPGDAPSQERAPGGAAQGDEQ